MHTGKLIKKNIYYIAREWHQLVMCQKTTILGLTVCVNMLAEKCFE